MKFKKVGFQTYRNKIKKYRLRPLKFRNGKPIHWGREEVEEVLAKTKEIRGTIYYYIINTLC